MSWGRKRNKYGNKKTMLDGIEFHSKGEAQRWAELKLLEASGHITKLQRQVVFPLNVCGQLICKYIADFTYQEITQSGNHDRYVTEDFKGGPLTAEFRIKAKLFKVLYGYPIKITRRVR